MNDLEKDRNEMDASRVSLRGGERSEPERSDTRDAGRGEARLVAVSPPDPEVPEKPIRRRFTAEYKLRILRDADRCTKAGEIGALLRREGLFSSHLSNWRRQRKEGTLKGLASKKRGRKAKKMRVLEPEVKELRKENRKLRRRLEKVEIMLDIQKKTSELLGIPLNGHVNDESDEDD